MASTARPFILDRQLDGVDTTSPGILIAENAWKQHHNMRPFNGRITQVPRKVELGRFASCYPHDVLYLANLPAGRLDYGLLVALTQSHVWQVHDTPSSSVKLNDVSGPLTFAYDNTYRRWAGTVYNGQLFFVNDLNPVAVTDGTTANFVSDDAPCARYITHFFDHLIVGRVTQDGITMTGRMLWSDLYRPSTWRPLATNESDMWDFEEDDTGITLMRGVTGLGKIADLLYVLTPTSIRPVSYVGLPKVFQVGPNLSGGIGNGLPYALVKANNTLFFFDVNEFNFFGFAGQGAPTAIGGPVQGYLQDNVSTDPELQSRTWGYHHPEFYEVVWVFISRGSTTFDRAVCFNYRSGRWYTRSVEGLHSFAGRVRRAKKVSELSGQVSALSSTADALGNSGTLLYRIWGGAGGMLYREEQSSDELTTLLEQDEPTLESRDYTYDNMQDVKEVNTITLNSSYTEAKGVQIEVSTRDLVDEAVLYRDQRLWIPESSFKRMTDVRRAGRIFRYRFTPLARDSAAEAVTQCTTTTANGTVEVALSAGNDPWMDSSYVPTGTAGEYFFGNDDAPPSEYGVYLYGGAGSNPYTELAQSPTMLAEARWRGYEFLKAGVYDGFVEPKWVYAASWNTTGQLANLYPSWMSIPTYIASGWYISLIGFVFADENPADIPEGKGPATTSASKTITIGGTAGVAYNAVLRIRASSSLANYSGGTGYTNHYVGGLPADGSQEYVKLTNGGVTYYLNYGTPTAYLVPIDYELTIPVLGGSSLTLEVNSQDGSVPGEGINGAPVKLAGYSPRSDLWARVDYRLNLATGTAWSHTSRTGGGTRGWKWTGYQKNIYVGGAEK